MLSPTIRVTSHSKGMPLPHKTSNSDARTNVIVTNLAFDPSFNYKTSRPSLTFIDSPQYMQSQNNCQEKQVTEYKEECVEVPVTNCQHGGVIYQQGVPYENCFIDYQLVCPQDNLNIQGCNSENVCKTVQRRTISKECQPIWRRQCSSAGYQSNAIDDCVKENKVLCTTITATKFVPLCGKNIPDCYNRHPVTKQVEKCEVVPQKSCRSVPVKACKKVKQTKCRLISKIVPVSECGSLPSKACSKVPEKLCSKVPVQVCRDETKKGQVLPSCGTKSQTVCNQVPVIRKELIC